jgi:uncharacterized protein (TIGR03118 family)
MSMLHRFFKVAGQPSTRLRHKAARPIAERLEERALLSQMHGLHALAHHAPKPPTFTQTNLVSNDTTVVPAAKADPNLVNAWGIVASPAGPFWVADNGTGVSTIYDGTGTPQPLVVTVPAASGTASPTGIVYNGVSTEFAVSAAGKTGASSFIFATEGGTISGWTPKVDATHAVIAVDNSASGAVYKGLALDASSGGDRLYATNFHAGTVDVFDTSFKPVTLAAGAFTDRKVPKGYAPFGIQNVGGNLVVTFAKQDSAKHDDARGKGRGFVDLFDANGTLLTRVGSKGTLNSPWGVAVAPSTYGKFAGDLLVGNFGDGRINAFSTSGSKPKFIGQLNNVKGKPLSINGLWGLSLGNGAKAGSATTLYFTAGPNGEQAGLFGNLTPSPTS